MGHLVVGPHILRSTLRSWKLVLAVDSGSRIPLPTQIARAIAADVRRGRLAPGAVLPGSRTLAHTLGVSRNTVYAAYEELAAEGWTTATRSGTCIASTLPEVSPRRETAKPHEGRDLMGFALEPNKFAPDPRSPKTAVVWDWGIPDVRLTPAQDLARAFRRVVKSHATTAFKYGAHAHPQLEKAMASMLCATRGLSMADTNLMVTRGSQMALYLLGRILFRPGDVVAVEHPGYLSAWEIFRLNGARIVPIAVDGSGLCVDQLERLIRSTPIRALFLTPHHQYPTTVTLAMDRRLRLLRLAREARFVIIEDDYDHEFHYDHRPVLPLASADSAGVVVYVGSLSKILAPGVRIGYVLAPPPLLQQLRALRRLVDIQSDLALDMALAELFDDGTVERHIRRSRRIYLTRRDCLAELLARHLAGVANFAVPAGGLAMWLRIDPDLDVEAWAKRAMALGLFIRTGSLFFLGGAPQPFLRLGFANFNERELQNATRLLSKALPLRGS